jgi:hypothetical protein
MAFTIVNGAAIQPTNANHSKSEELDKGWIFLKLGSAPLVISLTGKRKGNRAFLFFQKLTKGERKGSIFPEKLTMGKRKGFFSGKID